MENYQGNGELYQAKGSWSNLLSEQQLPYQNDVWFWDSTRSSQSAAGTSTTVIDAQGNESTSTTVQYQFKCSTNRQFFDDKSLLKSLMVGESLEFIVGFRIYKPFESDQVYRKGVTEFVRLQEILAGSLIGLTAPCVLAAILTISFLF
jgi:hypothetical protein